MKKTLTKIQAENLAISYSAFNDAVKTTNPTLQKVWARLLKNSQEETGIEMTSVAVLDFYMNCPVK